MAGEGDLGYLLRLELIKTMQRALAGGARGAGRQLEAFAKGMTMDVEGDMARVHGEVAAEMRAAVAGRYAETVEAQRRVPPYARSSRRSGYLGRAIRRPDLVTSDASGIGFINEASMNKEAAHWRRLNFGAGDAAGEQPAAVPIRLFGENVGEASLPYGPSPAFSLPKGFFIQGGQAVAPRSSYRGGGSVGAFTPSRRSPYRPAVTAGIRGRHFLEAGLEVVGEQLPRRYSDLLNEWVQRGGERARAISEIVT